MNLILAQPEMNREACHLIAMDASPHLIKSKEFDISLTTRMQELGAEITANVRPNWLDVKTESVL